MSNDLGLVLQVVGRLKGKQKGTFNRRDKWEVECPYCGRKTGMIGRVKTGDYFLYACPACNTSTSLKKMVTEKFPDLKKEFCLLYTSPSPRDVSLSRMPSSA